MALHSRTGKRESDGRILKTAAQEDEGESFD
jgi:hypothetical protein